MLRIVPRLCPKLKNSGDICICEVTMCIIVWERHLTWYIHRSLHWQNATTITKFGGQLVGRCKIRKLFDLAGYSILRREFVYCVRYLVIWHAPRARYQTASGRFGDARSSFVDLFCRFRSKGSGEWQRPGPEAGDEINPVSGIPVITFWSVCMIPAIQLISLVVTRTLSIRGVL